MTFLSGINPPIHQKIPLDVSSCHLQRAREPLANQPLGGSQEHLPNPHYQIKPKVQEVMVRFSNNMTSFSYRICIFQRTSSQLTRLRVNSRGEICNEPGVREDSSTCTSDSGPADAETGFGMDDKRVEVFCDGATTVPEGNNGTKEGAMVH